MARTTNPKTTDTTTTDTTTPETTTETPAYLSDPMYLATIPSKEISDLAYQIDRLAGSYEFKKGTEARMVVEMLKMASYALNRVNFSDLVAVEKANPAKGGE